MNGSLYNATDVAKTLGVPGTTVVHGYANSPAQIYAEKYSYTFEAIEHDHVFNSGVITTSPTCTVEGVSTRTCTLCGDTEINVIAALGHTTETKNARKATCTETGYTGDTVCTVCNQTITNGESISALGHTWNDGVVTISATCTTAGVGTYTCTVCNTSKTEAIKALGHSYTATVVAPTCTAKGYTLYECTRCAASYKDSETAMADHELTLQNTKEETCIVTGYTGDMVCTVCGQIIAQGTTISALGHTWNDGMVTFSATCTTAGVKTYSCTVCDATKAETIKALGHSYTATVIAPTCTAKGYTLYECTRCAASYKDAETAIIAHSWNAGTVTTSATCTTDGVKTYTCTECDETKTEPVLALGHSYTVTVVAPTYTAGGYTLHECIRCDNSYKSDETEKLYLNGDGDGDGEVTLKDVTRLFQYVNNQINSL
jgi:hypothetical protein